MMTNGDPDGRILLSHPHTNNGFFSCSSLNSTFLIFKKGSHKFLIMLRCDII